LWKNSKGYSGIIAGIFLVLLVLVLYSNVFMFLLKQNTSFQEEVSDVNQKDIDRSSEKLIVSNVNYTVVGDQVRVEAQVSNDGPVSVQIITLWVIDTTVQKYGYNNTLNINSKTGVTLNLTGSNAMIATIEGSNSSDVFTSWFVTARGNLIPLQKDGSQEIIVAQVALGIGSLMFEFDKFRWFTYEYPVKLADYPDGTLGFDVPKNTYMAFGCYLKNLDSKMRKITLDSHCLFWQPGRSGVGDTEWFLVNVDENGTIVSQSEGTFTDITLNYGEEEMLVFASDDDLYGTGAFTRMKTPAVNNMIVATNLLLHGIAGSDPFAQNIPWVSLFIS